MRGPGQGPQDDSQHDQEAPGQVQGQADEPQQVRARPHPRGDRLLPLREARHGVATYLQGQALSEVPEEAHRQPPARQEEARGDVRRAPGHEEARQVSGARLDAACTISRSGIML